MTKPIVAFRNFFRTRLKSTNNLVLFFFFSIQLMHYSHFKTQSLQHLKPIKC